MRATADAGSGVACEARFVTAIARFDQLVQAGVEPGGEPEGQGRAAVHAMLGSMQGRIFPAVGSLAVMAAWAASQQSP